MCIRDRYYCERYLFIHKFGSLKFQLAIVYILLIIKKSMKLWRKSFELSKTNYFKSKTVLCIFWLLLTVTSRATGCNKGSTTMIIITFLVFITKVVFIAKVLTSTNYEAIFNKSCCLIWFPMVLYSISIIWLKNCKLVCS